MIGLRACGAPFCGSAAAANAALMTSRRFTFAHIVVVAATQATPLISTHHATKQSFTTILSGRHRRSSWCGSGCYGTAGHAVLKEAYKNAFLIGTALDFRTPNEFNSAELEIIKSQFNVLTPENSMKPGSVHPQEDTWSWSQPDALVNF